MHSLSTRKQVDYKVTFWRDGRVVDYNGLENRRTERYRGFESLSLRIAQRVKSLSYNNLGTFYLSILKSCPTFCLKVAPLFAPLFIFCILAIESDQILHQSFLPMYGHKPLSTLLYLYDLIPSQSLLNQSHSAINNSRMCDVRLLL